MKTRTIRTSEMTLRLFFGLPAQHATHNLTSATSASTVAKTHDQKEVTVKEQGSRLCTITAMMVLLVCLSAPFVNAQSASSPSDPQAMLVILKDQPARQILEGLPSASSLQRKFAEGDLRQLTIQAGVPDQMKIDAATRLLKERFVETQAAAAEIRIETAPEQDLLAARLTGLGATNILHYTAFNMLEADIPESALTAVKQDPAVAEIIPVGAHQKLLDQIEQALSNPTELTVPVFNRVSSSHDPADQAFSGLIDQIIDERKVLVASSGDVATSNAVPAAVNNYSLKRFASLGTFDHLAVKATELNKQKPIFFSNSISAARPVRLYVGRAQGPFQATLAWDGHFTGNFELYMQSLDLMLYSKLDGTLVASSDSPGRDVQQVLFRNGGELVVKAKIQGGSVAAEPFALALSEQGFIPAEGPNLSVSCSGSPASDSYSCNVANDGDLPAYEVSASVEGNEYQLGTIQALAVANFSHRPHNSGGGSALVATVVSQSFGELVLASSGPMPRLDNLLASNPALKGPEDPSSQQSSLKVSATPKNIAVAQHSAGVLNKQPIGSPFFTLNDPGAAMNGQEFYAIQNNTLAHWDGSSWAHIQPPAGVTFWTFPAAPQTSPRRLFVVGYAGSGPRGLYQYSDVSPTWKNYGNPAFQVSVATATSQVMYGNRVYVVGDDNDLWEMKYDQGVNKTYGWTAFGQSALQQTPSVLQDGSLFFIDSSGEVIQMWWDSIHSQWAFYNHSYCAVSGWGPWKKITTAVYLGAPMPGSSTMFVVCSDGGVRHIWYDKSHGQWNWANDGVPTWWLNGQPVSGHADTPPVAVADGKLFLNVSISGTGLTSQKTLVQYYWNGRTWVWSPQGHPGSVYLIGAAASDSSSQNVYVRGEDNNYYTRYWNGTAWAWRQD